MAIRLEEISQENSLTQREIDDRLTNVSESVDQYLSKRGIGFRYNSIDRTFRTWYGKKLKVNYFAKLGYHVGSGKFHSNQININILRGTRLVPPRLCSDEEIVDTLLHEKIHQDIGIIETPLACLGIPTFAVLTRNILGTVGLLAGYLVVREIAVDVIKRIKYGKI